MTFAGKDYDLPVHVVPGSAVFGVARDRNTAQPLAGLRVGVAMGPILTAFVRTDAQGRWAVPDLPTGKFGVDLQTDGDGGECTYANAKTLDVQGGEITAAGSVQWFALSPRPPWAP
jgi:hypothetical protein